MRVETFLTPRPVATNRQGCECYSSSATESRTFLAAQVAVVEKSSDSSRAIPASLLPVPESRVVADIRFSSHENSLLSVFKGGLWESSLESFEVWGSRLPRPLEFD